MESAFNAIADGLSSDGYAVSDQFLSQAETHAILSLSSFEKASQHLKPAAVGKQQSRQVNESIRGDLIQWIDKTQAPPALSIYLAKIERLRHFLNQQLFLGLRDFEIHMTVYPPGAFYKRHLDQFKRDGHRKISVICYLNDSWNEDYGGQLRMYVPEGHLDVMPNAGRLVCFRSDRLEHEVLPATRHRMSLTGWMLDVSADGY